MAFPHIAPPEKFQLKEDSEKEWRFFRQKFELYLLAAGFQSKTDEVKVALLLTHGGDELLRIYNTLDFGAPVRDSDGNVTSDPSKEVKTVLS